MAPVAAALIAIGSSLGASGAAAGIVGGVTAIGSLASTGLGIAQAAGAFEPKIPRAPGFSSPAAGAARLAARKRRREIAARNETVVGGRQLGPGAATRSTALFGPGATEQIDA